MNMLDEIFADVLHIKKPPVKKAAPIAPLAKLQKALDQLTGTGPDRCDLSKVDTHRHAPARRKVMVVKATERRDRIFHDQTGDESLATCSSREFGKGNRIAKADAEDSIVLHGGFVSKGQITGEH